MVFSNCSLANPMDIINQVVQKIPDHCFVFIRNATNRTAIKWKVWWHLNFPWTFCFSVFNCFFTQLDVMFISSAFLKSNWTGAFVYIVLCYWFASCKVNISCTLTYFSLSSSSLHISCLALVEKEINPLHAIMSIHVPYTFL